MLSFILSDPAEMAKPSIYGMPGLKSDLSKFRSWNFGTKADKSEVVRKLEQIRIYSEDFQKKTGNFCDSS